MKIRPTALLLVLLTAATVVHSKECTQAEGIAAEEQTDYLDSWTKVYHAYVRYGHCDDGGVAEGYSDAVVKLLSRRWKRLGELASLIGRDSTFGKFVFRHIDETADTNDLVAIENLAKNKCPTDYGELCGRIAARIRRISNSA